MWGGPRESISSPQLSDEERVPLMRRGGDKRSSALGNDMIFQLRMRIAMQSVQHITNAQLSAPIGSGTSTNNSNNHSSSHRFLWRGAAIVFAVWCLVRTCVILFSAGGTDTLWQSPHIAQTLQLLLWSFYFFAGDDQNTSVRIRTACTMCALSAAALVLAALTTERAGSTADSVLYRARALADPVCAAVLAVGHLLYSADNAWPTSTGKSSININDTLCVRSTHFCECTLLVFSFVAYSGSFILAYDYRPRAWVCISFLSCCALCVSACVYRDAANVAPAHPVAWIDTCAHFLAAILITASLEVVIL